MMTSHVLTEKERMFFVSEIVRILKPGGYLLCFASTRTDDLMSIAIRMAGFRKHPFLAHIFGSGFPKATNLSKMLDKQSCAWCFGDGTIEDNSDAGCRPCTACDGTGKGSGVEREVIGDDPEAKRRNKGPMLPTEKGWNANSMGNGRTCPITAPATPEAAKWEGWFYGTQSLRPAIEPILMFQKPFDGKPVDSVAKWGCGALNIGASRVGVDERDANHRREYDHDFPATNQVYGKYANGNPQPGNLNKQGRWPSNLLISYPSGETAPDGTPLPNPVKEEVLKGFPESNNSGKEFGVRAANSSDFFFKGGNNTGVREFGDSGSSARFFKHCPYTEADYEAMRYFYCPKESDRTIQPAEDFPLWGESHEAVLNKHPTLKPLKLMEWLVRLVTSPGGTVLDPFMGSGTTGVAAINDGFSFIGFEKELLYYQMAQARIDGCNAEVGK